MRVLREDEHRPFLKGEIEFGLVDLEHRIRRRERAVRRFAVVHVVVADLADWKFDHTARLSVRDDLVGFVCGEQTAVVHEPGPADQLEGLRTESGARRADSCRTLPRRFRQKLDGLGEQPLLLRGVSDTRPEFVDPSVDADLMTAPRHNRRHQLRVEHGAHRRDEERRRHLVPIEEIEDPRHGRRRPVFANRQRHRQRVRSLQQLIVDIERETDGDPRAVRPGLGRELSADPAPSRPPAESAPLGIDGDRIHGARRRLA